MESHPTFFASASEFRHWLGSNAARSSEIILGLYQKSSGKAGITYAQALDEALCHGWIDGVRRRIDGDSYSIRFTPRKLRSIWSHVNVRHVNRLQEAGRMMSSGLEAFAARDPSKTGVYSFENPERSFGGEEEKSFRANAEAWAFFQSQSAGYKRSATWWIVNAKKAGTKTRRLTQLIDDSAHGRRLAHLVG